MFPKVPWEKRVQVTNDDIALSNMGESVYINFIGPFNAGKTECIKRLSETEVSRIERHLFRTPDWIQICMSLDFGQITLTEHSHLFLFGTPSVMSSQTFVFEKEDLNWGFLGTVMVVDSSRYETFREARYTLNCLRAYQDRPYVIAANHQDSLNAWDVIDLKNGLRALNSEIIVPCSALDKDSLKEVVLTLLYQVRDALDSNMDVTSQAI